MKAEIAKKFRKDQWLMLLITMFAYLFFYMGRHNFGWAARDMATDLNIPYETVGWISFAMLIGYAIGQLINGNLGDHYGGRVMVALGAVLSVLANIFLSFSGSVIVILLFWAFNGYFQAMAWAPGGSLISNWWPAKERGKAFGFYTAAAGASSVLTYLVSIIIVQQGVSWRYLFRLPVLLLLVAGIIFYLVARNKPEDKGYKNVFGKKTERKGDERDRQENQMEKTTWKGRYKVVLSNKKFLIASLSIGFQNMARYGLIFWAPVHFLGKNWQDSPEYLWITFLIPLGMAIGAFTLGNISDSVFKGNRPLSIVISMLISAVLAFFIFITPIDDIVEVGVLLFLSGFFVYGVQSNFWPMSPDLLGEKYTGTGIGIMDMSAYIFAALGEPLFGKIIDMTHDTNTVFMVVAIECLISAMVIALIMRGYKGAIKQEEPAFIEAEA